MKGDQGRLQRLVHAKTAARGGGQAQGVPEQVEAALSGRRRCAPLLRIRGKREAGMWLASCSHREHSGTALGDSLSTREDMPDFLSAKARSAHMRRIRKIDTKPELEVRRLVHRLGFRFRLHRRDLPGTPDLVFPRLKKGILVHGCFWHQHPGCRLARVPKSRLDYWEPKLRRNQERDSTARAELTSRGWKILVVWECETDDVAVLEPRLEAFLKG
jgi:DNA mismatch endonuclease (patch repair protein)